VHEWKQDWPETRDPCAGKIKWDVSSDLGDSPTPKRVSPKVFWKDTLVNLKRYRNKSNERLKNVS